MDMTQHGDFFVIDHIFVNKWIIGVNCEKLYKRSDINLKKKS